MRLGAVEDICDGLTFRGRERRNVDERLYPVIIRTRDHGAAIGVSRKHRRPARSLEYTPQRGYVVVKRCKGNWRARNFKAFLSERQDYVLPAGAVSPGAMNQHDR